MKNDFNKLLRQVMAEAKAAGIPISDKIAPTIDVNTRANTFFGRCICREEQFIIQLAASLYDVPEIKCRQTIAHELIHTCHGCYNHGALFKKYAAIMNKKYGYNIRSSNSNEEIGVKITRENAAYIIECQKCGARFARTRWCRLVEAPQGYRCYCGGPLKRIK